MGSDGSTLRDDHRMIKDLDKSGGFKHTLDNLFKGFVSFQGNDSEWEKATEKPVQDIYDDLRMETLALKHKSLKKREDSKTTDTADKKPSHVSDMPQPEVPMIDFMDKVPKKARSTISSGLPSEEDKTVWDKIKNFFSRLVEDEPERKIGRGVDTIDVKA